MSLMTPYIQHAHFYPDGGPSYAIRSFYDSRNRMDQQESLHTTQMALLDHENIRMYHVYIHEPGHGVWLINNGHGWDCDETPKDLRYEHNLYRLWVSGEFSSPSDGRRVFRAELNLPDRDCSFCPCFERVSNEQAACKLAELYGDSEWMDGVMVPGNRVGDVVVTFPIPLDCPLEEIDGPDE